MNRHRSYDRHQKHRRPGYDGPVDVLVDDEVTGTIDVSLTGYVDVITTRRGEQIEGLKSWDGHLRSGRCPVSVGEVIDLRTPDGRTGQAFFLTAELLTGSGEPPFDL